MMINIIVPIDTKLRNTMMTISQPLATFGKSENETLFEKIIVF